MTGREFMWTIHPNNKTGVRLDKASYERVKHFILKESEHEQGISVNELLVRAEAHLGNSCGREVGWLVYQVKLDLEARGLIQHEKDQNARRRVIRNVLTRKLEKNNMNIQDQEVSTAEVNEAVKQKFTEIFNSVPMVVHSPGRINLIGEHTDYNGGYVMPAAIDKGIQFAITPSKGLQSIIYSLKYNEYYSIDHSNLSKVERPEWVNYLMGVLHQFKSKGINVKPFNCVFAGDLPTGAGLSSSAAMECGFAFALNELNHRKLSKLDMIQMAQWAEHNYVGVKCGIMDQFTSMMGLKDQVIVLDCQNLSYSYYPLELGDYALVLCDTKVKHSLASSEYNTRRAECETGVAILKSIYPEVNTLRDVTVGMLLEHRDLFSETIFNRCYYVVQENERVLKGSDDLKNGRLAAFGKKLFATHEGLSKLFNVSCAELDFLVDEARTFNGVIGARMMGGGFGGCTLNVIHQDVVGDFVYHITRAYKEKFDVKPALYVVKTGNGTSVIENPFT